MFPRKNVALGPPLKLSPWRKLAIGTWRSAGDPSVYGTLDIEAGPALAYIEEVKRRTGRKITLTHFVGKAIGETLRRHPKINCILRYGRLYPRTSVDIFFQIASDTQGNDLSGGTIRNADQKSIDEIAAELQAKADRIRQRGDEDFKGSKNIIGMLPGMLSKFILNFAGFVMYTLNIYHPALGSPRDPFGSCMITSIGSLGLEMAFAPLVPYSRIPLLLAVGALTDEVAWKDGQAVPVKRVRICATFDHRLIDGIHAAHMSATMKKIFANPEKEFPV
jgi:pyruvate dehydrogenase E2 component (dihydrolipoamide acetyltransferase)